MNNRNYQMGLTAAIAVCIALASVLAYVLIHPRPNAAVTSFEDSIVARGPELNAQSRQTVQNSHTNTEPSLAPVQISAARLQQIGVTTAAVAFKEVVDNVNAPGNVEVDEQKLSYVQTRFPGWIKDVFANATFQYVRKGQVLFTVYSPDLVSSEQEYLLAMRNQKTSSQDSNSMAMQESGWLLNAAEERLRQFGVPDQEIEKLKQTGKVQRNMSIDSPSAGYILERNALPNAYVQPDTKLYTIADLSTVWVYANVFQNDVGRLKPGDAATVTVDSYPGRRFHGRIDQILPQVDPVTRTVRVRLVLANPGVVLKPGMFVNVAITVPLGKHLLIPASAVLQAGTRTIAFIDHGNGNLEPRVIETGTQLDDSIVVLSGLKEGEQVVTSANFLVDSEAQLQSAFRGTAPATEGPSTSATSSTQLNIEMVTQPSPARKGTNTLRVSLISADAKPVSGANVAVTFFMPAMPAMGMAAMRTTANLAEKSNGQYEGQLALGSGGTWHVTIQIQQNGHTIATKELTVDATGGM